MLFVVAGFGPVSRFRHFQPVWPGHNTKNPGAIKQLGQSRGGRMAKVSQLETPASIEQFACYTITC